MILHCRFIQDHLQIYFNLGLSCFFISCCWRNFNRFVTFRWRENVQFGFVIEPQANAPNPLSVKTKVIIVLTQDDVRMTGNSKWSLFLVISFIFGYLRYNDIGFYICRVAHPYHRHLFPLPLPALPGSSASAAIAPTSQPSLPSSSINPAFPDVIFVSNFAGQRACSANLSLLPGNYAIIPCTFHPGQDISFVLDVYVSNRAAKSAQPSASASALAAKKAAALQIYGPHTGTQPGLERKAATDKAEAEAKKENGVDAKSNQVPDISTSLSRSNTVLIDLRRVVVKRITANLDWKVFKLSFRRLLLFIEQVS